MAVDAVGPVWKGGNTAIQQTGTFTMNCSRDTVEIYTFDELGASLDGWTPQKIPSQTDLSL